MKKKIKEWLKKLEEANKEEFGNKPLDCCTVGKDKKNVNTTKSSTKSK